ncbi:hypothetical protein [Enterococcus gallinarum]|uniref:hypothetical protein n=1 Tax=Enterococcus gallinarum TaxID=1353 RepID=UPI0035D78AC6
MELDNKIELLIENVVNYASENKIGKIIIFAKQKENVLKLYNRIQKSSNFNEIKVLVTTFPMNQVLYMEGENGDIEEVFPPLYDENERKALKNIGIEVMSGTLPLDSVIIPGFDSSPFDVIKRTMNLFGEGIDLAIQSALMTTDAGLTIPGERVISMNTATFIDINTTNSRFLFHPEKKIVINSLFQ